MFRLRRSIQAALPCLCAFLLMGIYALELLPQLNLTAVNLICLLLACLKLFPGIVNAVNTRKAECFSSSLLIAAAALAVNLRGQLPPSLSALSAWETLWTGLAAVLLRLLRWSQENWERERAETQERRRNRRESWRNWWKTWGQYWARRLTARREYVRNQVQSRREYAQKQIQAHREYKWQVRENRRAAKLKWKYFRQTKKWLKKVLEIQEWQQILRALAAEPSEQPDQPPRDNSQNRETRQVRHLRIFQDIPKWGWSIIIVVSVAVVCGITALLIWIPTIQGLGDTVEGWSDNVETMMEPLITVAPGEDGTYSAMKLTSRREKELAYVDKREKPLLFFFSLF